MDVRELYKIYDNKAYVNAEAAEGLALLGKEVQEIGYRIVVERGDVKK
jgi:biotin synthase